MAIKIVNGQRFLADEAGNVIQKKTFVSEGFSGGNVQTDDAGKRFIVEDSGFEVDDQGRTTGREFSTTTTEPGGDTGRAPITKNVREKGTPEKAGGEFIAGGVDPLERLRISAGFGGRVGNAIAAGEPGAPPENFFGQGTPEQQAAQSSAFGAKSFLPGQTLPGERTGKEKIAGDAFAGKGFAAPAGSPTKTRAEINAQVAATDFATEQGVFSTPDPVQKPNEDASSFALRLASKKLGDAKKAYNELTGLTLGQIEAQKFMNLAEQEATNVPTFAGFDENFKTRADIIKDSESDDRLFNRQYNQLVEDLKGTLTNEKEKNIKNKSGVILGGNLNAATRAALEAEIIADEEENFNTNFNQQKKELDRKLAEARESFVETSLDLTTGLIGKAVDKPDTFEEKIKKEELRLAEMLFSTASQQGITMTRQAALTQAKKMLSLQETKKDKTKEIQELNNLFVNGGMTRGNELSAAYGTLQNYKDATDWIATLPISASESKLQKFELLRSLYPDRSDNSILSQLNTETAITDLTSIVKGDVTDPMLIGSILDNATDGERTNTIRAALANKELPQETREFLEEVQTATTKVKTVEDLSFSQREIYDKLIGAFKTGGKEEVDRVAGDILSGFEIDLTGVRQGDLNIAHAQALKDSLFEEAQKELPREEFINLSQETEQAEGELETPEQKVNFFQNLLDNTKEFFGGIVGKETTVVKETEDGTEVTQITKVEQDTPLFENLIRQESGGKVDIPSPVGAIGLTQLMPATAREVGLEVPDELVELQKEFEQKTGAERTKLGNKMKSRALALRAEGVTDERFDAEKNKEGGQKYLQKQLDRFGDIRLALAAYNWGPFRVQSALDRSEEKTFEGISSLVPDGVKRYVSNINVGAPVAKAKAKEKGGEDEFDRLFNKALQNIK